jgi:hypothetical protein
MVTKKCLLTTNPPFDIQGFFVEASGSLVQLLVAQRKWSTISKEVKMDIVIGINPPLPPLFYVCPACD